MMTRKFSKFLEEVSCITILIENLRREGFELSVSKPKVVYKTTQMEKDWNRMKHSLWRLKQNFKE